MTAPHHPWWKRKRWIAAVILWLVLVYPLSFGMVVYADGRGWIAQSWYPMLQMVYTPFFFQNKFHSLIEPVVTWIYELARQHR